MQLAEQNLRRRVVCASLQTLVSCGSARRDWFITMSGFEIPYHGGLQGLVWHLSLPAVVHSQSTADTNAEGDP